MKFIITTTTLLGLLVAVKGHVIRSEADSSPREKTAEEALAEYNGSIGLNNQNYPQQLYDAAYRLRFSLLPDVNKQLDVTIFDGVSFPNFETAFPYLISGENEGFEPAEVRLPYENSINQLLRQELLHLYKKDPKKAKEAVEPIDKENIENIGYFNFVQNLFEKGLVREALDFKNAVGMDDHPPIDYYPELVQAFSENPDLFFEVFPFSIYSAGLKMALVLQNIPVQRLVEKYSLEFALMGLLRESEQEYFNNQNVRQKILHIYNSMQQKDCFTELTEYMLARGLLTEAEAGVPLVINSLGVAEAAFRAGNTAAFVEIMALNRYPFSFLNDSLFSPQLLTYLSENIRNESCRHFILNCSDKLFRNQELFFKFYGFSSMEDLLRGGPLEALDHAAKFIGTKGTLRQFVYFNKVATAEQLRNLARYFMRLSEHADDESARIFRYFLSLDKGFMPRVLEGPESRIMIGEGIFMRILKDKALFETFVVHPMITNRFIYLSSSSLKEMMAKDEYFSVLLQYKQRFQSCKPFLRPPIRDNLTPKELDRLLHFIEYDMGVFCSESINFYVTDDDYRSKITALIFRFMHYIRKWHEFDPEGLEEYVSDDERTLERIVIEDFPDNGYFFSILPYFDRATKSLIRKLLIITKMEEGTENDYEMDEYL